VESAPGKGTRFTVLLPAEQESVAPFTVNESITELARGEGLVLVIDDEVAIRSAVQNSLEDLDPKDVVSALTAAGAQPGAYGLAAPLASAFLHRRDILGGHAHCN
jgi:hypothetical protein